MHYRRLADWSKIIDKIEKGEKKKHRLSDIRKMIQEKVELHLESIYNTMYPGVEDGKVAKELLEQHSPIDLLMYSWPKMQFKYGQGQKGFSYQQEEDAFLLVMMHRHGYGAARRIQLEIRRAWQFRFNWFFKSRSPQEIQKRCDILVSHHDMERSVIDCVVAITYFFLYDYLSCFSDPCRGEGDARISRERGRQGGANKHGCGGTATDVTVFYECRPTHSSSGCIKLGAFCLLVNLYLRSHSSLQYRITSQHCR